MTAVNVVCHRDAAHVLTDGAACDLAAPPQIMHLTSKVWIMPHLSAAVAIAGNGLVGPALHWILSAAPTFDRMREIAIYAMTNAMAHVSRFEGFDPNVIAIVAGISESGGSSAFAVTNFERDDWQVVDAGAFSIQPANDRIQASIPVVFSHLESHEDFDPVSDGMRLLELQRAERICAIGGYAQLTSVTHAGITSRVIHRFGD